MKKKSPWKIVAGLLVIGVLVLLMLAAWIAFRAFSAVSEARIQWEQAEKELLTKGETLSVEDFVPPPIPDEQNFFADPLWEDLSDRVEAEKKGGHFMKARLPLEKRQTYDLNRPLSEDERLKLEKDFPEFAPLDVSKDAVHVARELWKQGEDAGSESKRRAAEFILAASSMVEPILSRIERLADRSEARFPIHYEDGIYMGLEHVAPLLGAAQWLQLRGLVAIEQRQPYKAAADVFLILRLATVFRNEPVLLSQMVRASMDSLAVEVINQGIREHTWTGSNLRNFESALAEIDLIPALALALRFERASFNISIDSLLRSGNNEVFNESFGSGKASSPATRYPFYWFWVYRQFVFPDDKAYYNQAIQTWVEALDQASQVGVSSRQLPKFSAAAKASVFENKKRLFSALIFPGLESGIVRVALIQNQIVLTRIACALELYRLEEGDYPESLDALAPRYFDTLPADLTTLQAPRYRKRDEGDFELWSLGWNGSDEGGRSDKNRKKADWVWGG